MKTPRALSHSLFVLLLSFNPLQFAAESVRIGEYDPKRHYGWVEIPKELKARISEVIGKDETKWTVNHIPDFGRVANDGVGYKVVEVSNETTSFRALRFRGKWTPTDGEAGVKVISQIYGPRIVAEVARRRESNIELYASQIAFLSSGPVRAIAAPRAFTTISPAWLRGKIRDPEKLKNVLHVPKLTEKDGAYTLSFRVITGRGSIEEWNITGRLKEESITAIRKEEIMEGGTFSWGRVP